MSKGTRVGVGGILPRPNLASAVVRAVAVGLAGMIVAAGWTAAPGVAPGVAPVVVEAAQAPAADGGFTAEQAAAGWTVYARQCGECHGENLDGAEAPALRGVDFLNGWAGQTTDELFEYLRDGMPPGLGGSLSRFGLPGAGRLPPGRERRPAGRRAADGGRGGHDRQRRGHRRGAAGGGRGRAAPAQAVAVRQPGGAARSDPGHRCAAGGPAAGRLAELASDAQQPRLQSARSDHARQRRRTAAGLGAGHPGGEPPDDAAGARRRDVPGEPRERRAGDRRGHRQRHLAVPLAAAGGCAPAGAGPHAGALRRQGVPRDGRRGAGRARRADRQPRCGAP